jgi:hypothetical protein
MESNALIQYTGLHGLLNHLIGILLSLLLIFVPEKKIREFSGKLFDFN